MYRPAFITGILLYALTMLMTPSTAMAEENIVYLPLVTFDAQPMPYANVAGRPANAEGVPWRDHRVPWDFKFGNRMDQHQQSKEDGKDRLTGFLYIAYTGEYTKKGVPIATHTDCTSTGTCTVGWTMHGIRGRADLISSGMGQPQWCIPAGEWPAAPGYTHFHWIRQGEDHGSGLQPGTYDGYLIKLTAVERFAFGHSSQHGGSDGCAGDDHGGLGGPPDDVGSCEDHEEGGCGEDHEEGGCGEDHEEGGCGEDHEEGGCGEDHEEGGCGEDHEEGGCGEDHEEGGCGEDHEEGGCGGNGLPKHIPLEPGIDLVSHVNVTICD